MLLKTNACAKNKEKLRGRQDVLFFGASRLTRARTEEKELERQKRYQSLLAGPKENARFKTGRLASTLFTYKKPSRSECYCFANEKLALWNALCEHACPAGLNGLDFGLCPWNPSESSWQVVSVEVFALLWLDFSQSGPGTASNEATIC